MPSRTPRISVASRLWTTECPSPIRFWSVLLHRVHICDEYVPAQWSAVLAAGLCHPLRSPIVPTAELAYISRGDLASEADVCFASQRANVVLVHGVRERFAERCGGRCTAALDACRTWYSVRLPSRFLALPGCHSGGNTGSIGRRRCSFVGCAGPGILAYLAKLVFGRCASQPDAYPAIVLPGS